MVIAQETASCLQNFTECLTVEALMENEWAENRLADFNLWVYRVGASAQGRASLDLRLTTRPKARQTIANILHMLSEVVRDCKGLALSGNTGSNPEPRNHRPACPLAPDQPPARPFSPWSDESSDSQENVPQLDSTMGDPLRECMQNIDMVLDQLARIAVAVRQLGRNSRLQKADHRFRPSNHEGLEAHLNTILLARREVSKDQIDTPRLSDVQQRLVYCNLKRRNRFLYAQQHSKQSNPLSTENHSHSVVPVNTMDPTDAQPGRHNDNKSQPANIGRAAGGYDAKTGTSTSALNHSCLLYTDPVPVPAAPVASTITSTAAVDLEYPLPPSTDDDAHEFRCPCCCVTLPAELLEGNRWKKHVAEDVAPYTCILPGCSKPHILYNTKETWRKHLLTEHPSFEYWVCFACRDNKEFRSEDAFSAHMRKEHKNTIPQDRIALLTSICKRSAPVEITSCPLCNWPDDNEGQIDKDMLLDHIAKEVHAFSLRALPWADDNGQVTNEKLDRSTAKVRDWLVKSNLSTNTEQERPCREDIIYASDYSQRSAYFGGNSEASTSGEPDIEHDKLKEAEGSVSFESEKTDSQSEESAESNNSEREKIHRGHGLGYSAKRSITQRKHKKAEAMYKHSLHDKGEMFGSADSDTQASVNDFGGIIYKQGGNEDEEAKAVHQPAMPAKAPPATLPSYENFMRFGEEDNGLQWVLQNEGKVPGF